MSAVTHRPPPSPAAATIIQRRTQMFVHSYLYYVLDRPIVSDHQWQAWANELVLLQRNHPKLKVGFYDEDFADWDGTTGMHLPQYPWVVDRGAQLLHLHDNPALRSGYVPELADIDENLERTRQQQIATARDFGRAAGRAGRERRPYGYLMGIEADAWIEGYDEARAADVTATPVTPDLVGQMALF